jgi:aldehyde dehydrogenase (NAD+)
MNNDALRFYIDGQWCAPSGTERRPIINPSNEDVVGHVAMGNSDDVDRAVSAAKRAFASFSQTSVEDRIALLEAINAELIRRNDEIADAISIAMGAPTKLARGAQAPSGTQHFSEIIRLLREYRFEVPLGSTMIRREPVGVCALITPWNWPMNQIATKVAPALGAGCTMILKPSELAPLDAVILAEIMDTVGVPPGVFNLVHGDGAGVGERLTSHPDVDMVSFTGSTRAGIAISQNAAPTIKRVALELGGKSANIILPSADLSTAIPRSVRDMALNSGQSCNAPTRLFVPRRAYPEVRALAAQTADAIQVGPADSEAQMGPIANKAQFDRVVAYIEKGITEGADLIAGGCNKVAGERGGYYVRPTIFGKVTPAMTIAREEIFGPVLSILLYDEVDEAIQLANESEYGLSGYVWGEPSDARTVAAKLRTGMVHINGASLDTAAPFGGYKKSGNGREWGVFGLEEFLEVKSIYGGIDAR